MRKLIPALFVAISVFTSCDREEEPVTPPVGTIVGFVSLYNEFGIEIEDKAGITVTLVGGGTEKVATTDEQGKFTVADVLPGSYDVRFEKTGFGTEKLFGIQFTAGTQPLIIQDVPMHQLTTTNFLIFDVSLYEPFEGFVSDIVLSATIDPFATQRRSFIIFVHTSSAVSDTNFRFYKTMSLW